MKAVDALLDMFFEARSSRRGQGITIAFSKMKRGWVAFLFPAKVEIMYFC